MHRRVREGYSRQRDGIVRPSCKINKKKKKAGDKKVSGSSTAGGRDFKRCGGDARAVTWGKRLSFPSDRTNRLESARSSGQRAEKA